MWSPLGRFLKPISDVQTPVTVLHNSCKMRLDADVAEVASRDVHADLGSLAFFLMWCVATVSKQGAVGRSLFNGCAGFSRMPLLVKDGWMKIEWIWNFIKAIFEE